jgi:hypothetical protein
LKKDLTAYADFRNGDGSKIIWVTVNNADRVQYKDSVGATQTLRYTLQTKWNHIEFRNINWVAGTYDIYVDGFVWETGLTMTSGTNYEGELRFGSWDGSGTFWIDDISDSLRQL